MHSLANNDSFKQWFIKQEEIAKKEGKKDSRLYDRLNYIVRG
jgi:hypothetical protein